MTGQQNKTKESSSFLQELLHPQINTVYRVRGGVDRIFLIIVVLLLCYGSVMVFSSSYVFAKVRMHDSLWFVKKQIFFAIVGIVVMMIVSFIDYGFIKKFTVPIFAASFLMLAAVPFIGQSNKGATRWLKVGPIQFQPSEIMKFALVLLLASYISFFSSKIKQFKYGILIPAAITGVVCVTTLLEHHMSGTIILFLIGASMIFMSGANLKVLATFGGIFGAGALGVMLFTNYMKKRIDAWLHPELYLKTGGWQPYQSLLAIGSGGLFGVGLGNSYQKHMWLPEPQNDFIFAILCEELGFIGAIALIALFVLFTWRGFVIAKRAPDTFSSVLVAGLTAKVGIQAMLNIAVVTASIPTTGIALPFFSYGGTALVMQLAEMGIILSVSRYSSQSRV